MAKRKSESKLGIWFCNNGKACGGRNKRKEMGKRCVCVCVWTISFYKNNGGEVIGVFLVHI